MVKTVIIPQNNSIHLSVPEAYIGKEIEILLYAKEELTEAKPAVANNAARFKGILTTEEADQYDTYLQKARNEWDRTIKHCCCGT